MDEEKKLRIFHLIVESAAEVWFCGLTDGIKQNWDLLQEAFNHKYIDANNLTWLKEQCLLNRDQSPRKSVEVYITDVRQKCSQLQKGEAETINFAWPRSP